MSIKNIFSKEVTAALIGRIQNLTDETQPNWGTMSVSQMLAHCCVTYEMVYTDKYPRPNVLTRFILKTFIKKTVISDSPYPKNGKTAPQFIIKNTTTFVTEKTRLIDFIKQTQVMGAAAFEGKESHSFGKLTSNEWNALFYKHITHHLTQFGV